ncbi:hypothetical protein N656DRAFT_779424 [Canariomyces notabilis]|uniref:Uncharacterized protein n=1 Tax=Canariomyces notabilis TaxID=2074819 RepID=A0AAN6TDU1_9PEZI|nr:hypothetical protein N656DRAFT_779424 [Canariomyces arenarius]
MPRLAQLCATDMPLPTRASRGTYCRALGRQGVKDPSILHWHRGLHFEFELVFEQIVPDSADMPLIIVLIYPLERKTLPLSTLHELWSGLPSNGWPDAVNISSLRFVRQIDTVYLAETPGPGGKELTIFIGHRLPGLAVSRELRFLLTSRPIRTSCRKPLGIVTKRSAFGSKQGIVGFLLRYLPAGSIRDILPAKQRAGTLSNRVTVQVELVPAGHKRNHPRSSLESVSDRRPDTVLLDGDRGVVLLCDFEQCNAATGMSGVHPRSCFGSTDTLHRERPCCPPALHRIAL